MGGNPRPNPFGPHQPQSGLDIFNYGYRLQLFSVVVCSKVLWLGYTFVDAHFSSVVDAKSCFDTYMLCRIAHDFVVSIRLIGFLFRIWFVVMR